MLLASISVSIMYIGITWYILISHNGEILYGLIILIGTVTGFALSNFIGKIIDKYDRKKLFVLLNIIISVSFLIIFLSLIKYIKLNVSVLFILYMIISVYSIFYWNVITSITQQIFSINEYKSINSKMEIIGQASAAFSIIGGLIIYSVNFLFIIIISSIIFAVSAIIFRNVRMSKLEKI